MSETQPMNPPEIQQMSPELTAVDIDNLIALLGRVELKGSEAKVYVGLEMKLAVLKRTLAPQAPAAD